MGPQRRRNSHATHKTEQKPTITGGNGNRRKQSLIIITAILNLLLWSSLICIAASLHQILSNPLDSSSYPQVALTTTSALVTIGYIFFHTIFSLKQKLWEQQQRHVFAIKRTSSTPTHLAASLCALWMLTSGWNMILVARRPVCLQMAAELQSWEHGFTCLVSRVAITFAAIDLGASIALFGILAKVSRPFEAHVFDHGYRPSTERHSKSHVPEPSKLEIGSYDYQRNIQVQWRPRPSYDTRVFNPSNVDATGSNNSLPRSTTLEPFTVCSPSTGFFTCHHAPPPIPAAYITPRRNSLPSTFSLASQLRKDESSFTGSPQSFGIGNSPDFAHQPLPTQLSASIGHTVHPNPNSLAFVNRSRPDVPSARFCYQNPYSHSSTSVNRPRRLSCASAAPSISSRAEHKT